jgi:Phytanoyl-CoA dioxygenase (PhyH)
MELPSATAADDALVTSLRTNGYVVLPGAVADGLCVAVISALDEVLGIRLDDPATWSRIDPEFDMVPMWGHQSQWDIRQLPNLHDAWSRIWGRRDLWVDVNSCRITPPWRDGLADALTIHFDVDPHDSSLQWFPGLVALADAPVGHGGFCCVPALFRDRDLWPTTWPAAGGYRPTLGPDDEIIEVPLRRGDVLIWDSRLPHGTVRNLGPTPRAVFYLQLHRPGTEADLVERLSDIDAGRAPPWVRWKPGHDRLDQHPISLSPLGRQLLGREPFAER